MWPARGASQAEDKLKNIKSDWSHQLPPENGAISLKSPCWPSPSHGPAFTFGNCGISFTVCLFSFSTFWIFQEGANALGPGVADLKYYQSNMFKQQVKINMNRFYTCQDSLPIFSTMNPPSCFWFLLMSEPVESSTSKSSSKSFLSSSIGAVGSHALGPDRRRRTRTNGDDDDDYVIVFVKSVYYILLLRLFLLL